MNTTTNSANSMNTTSNNTTAMNTTNLNRPFHFLEIYHSHYDDDYAENYYYNPVTREITTDSWTTAAACGPYMGGDYALYKLIDEGLVDKDTFIDDLLSKYKVNPTDGLFFRDYRGYGVSHARINLPIEMTGHKYKGNATLLYISDGWRSRYGRVENHVYHILLEDGTYAETSSLKYIVGDAGKEALRKRLHEVDVKKAVEFILPWNEAENWAIYPLTEVPNAEELETAYKAKKAADKLEKSRPFLMQKYTDLLNWSKEKFGDTKTAEEHVEMAKHLLRKHYDVNNEEFLLSLVH